MLGDITQMDARLATRLKRGELPIDVTLDLHGHTAQEAFKALQAAIPKAYRTGQRLVLVITGQGKQGAGILKTSFPAWLESPEIKPLLLAAVPAQPRHGGHGAFYVLLKRRRQE